MQWMTKYFAAINFSFSPTVHSLILHRLLVKKATVLMYEWCDRDKNLMVVKHHLSLVCPPPNDSMCEVQDLEHSCPCADDICCWYFIKYHINERPFIDYRVMNITWLPLLSYGYIQYMLYCSKYSTGTLSNQSWSSFFHLLNCRKVFQPEELWSNLLFNKKMNVNVLMDCDLFCIDSSH